MSHHPRCRELTFLTMMLAMLLGFGLPGCDVFQRDDDDLDDERFATTGFTEQDFIDEAYSSNLLEIESSQLALNKNASMETRDFARRMVREHQQVNQELLELANDKDLREPSQMTTRHRRMLDQLEPLEGQTFTQQYHSMQRQAHEEAIDLYQRAANELVNEDIRQWAREQLAVLREHRDELREHQH